MMYAPALASDYLADLPLREAISHCKRFLSWVSPSLVFRPDGACNLERYLCMPVTRYCRTHFLAHIVAVFSGRSKSKMIRVHAGRVIAPVHNKRAIGYCPEMEGVRISMCAVQSRGGAPSTASPERAIPIAVNKPRPQPAIIGLFNFRPKSLFNWDAGPCHENNYTPAGTQKGVK